MKRREEKSEHTTHWNVDYSMYTNLISNSIHQTLHFLYVNFMVGIWFFLLHSSLSFAFQLYLPIQKMPYFNLILSSHTHAQCVCVSEIERKKNDFSCIYIWNFLSLPRSPFTYMDSPSIHHLKHKNLNLWNVPWKTD